jgi:hypothetical protein
MRLLTVPTLQYRNGDFSQALTRRNLGNDQLGRAILENTIYDPATGRNQVGLDGNVYPVRNPFPDNVVPVSVMDPVAFEHSEADPSSHQFPSGQ